MVVRNPKLVMDDTWLICENESIEIVADVGFDEYLWSTGETSQSINVDKVGSYEVTVFVQRTGNYEYSLDGIQYQDSNKFNNLSVDDYTFYVRDKNGCGVVSGDIYLMYYPHFFTPNGEGYNDTWHIVNFDKEPSNKIYIYDNRYGKLLKQLNSTDKGWDGTFNVRFTKLDVKKTSAVRLTEAHNKS